MTNRFSFPVRYCLHFIHLLNIPFGKVSKRENDLFRHARIKLNNGI